MTKHHHYIIYKPDMMVSQFKDNRRGKKRLLGELHDFAEGTMAIGRLDEMSEGLLFLTTDGMKSEEIRSKKIEKEYWAQVDGEISFEAVKRMQEGIEIGVKGEKYTTLPCKVYRINHPVNLPPRKKKIRDPKHGPTSWVSITVTEGKFRQVRKMTSAVGFPTLRLVRVRIGDVELGNMQPGEVIEVDDFSSQ